VVEAIEADGGADLVRAWSDEPHGHFRAGWERTRGQLSDGKLSIDYWYSGKDKPGGERRRMEFAFSAPDRLHGAQGDNSVDLPRFH